jgi:hypothetical protein
MLLGGYKQEAMRKENDWQKAIQKKKVTASKQMSGS